MRNSPGKTAPLLECRELAAYATDRLDDVRAAFEGTDRCPLQQSWLAAPDASFAPAAVCVGWRGNSFRLLAELEDADIFSRATAHNQRMWELGDVLEIFLQPAMAPGYFEFHVTPDNFRLQLRFPDTATVRRAQAANRFDELMLPDGAFRSSTWKQPENHRWYVHAEIPANLVCGSPDLPVDQPWRFSFSRYDYTRGQEPVISSSSPHAQPDFHRREEWGTVFFHPRK